VYPQDSQVRITRFRDLQPQSGYDSPVDDWRGDESLSAKMVYLLLGPPRHGASVAGQPAIVVDKGMSVTIVECPPGSTPVLPTFLHTRETFVCLKGRFRARWGEHADRQTFLDPFDMIALPPSECREFVNVTDDSAFLLVVLTGQTDEAEQESEARSAAGRRDLVMRLALAAIGTVSVLGILVYALWAGPASQGSPRPPAPSPAVSAVTEGAPGGASAPPGSRPSAVAASPKTASGPETKGPAEFVRIPPPPSLPNVAAVIPVVVGREATVRVGTLSVTVQRTPGRESKSRLVDYTVTVTDHQGTPMTAADVRLRGQTLEGSTLEARLDPSPIAGVYRSAVIMPAAGFRQMTLQIVLAETLWEAVQRTFGITGPAVAHVIRLQTQL
jgi:uncharacterized RmlC-like cupin family protein